MYVTSQSYNQDKINNLNRFITSNGIEAVMKNLQTIKNPCPDGFTAEFIPDL